MYKKKIDVDIRSPLEYGKSILAGKWKTRIICLLGNGSAMRFKDFKADFINITDGVLAETLNELVRMDVVEKSTDLEERSMTEYKLTEKGRSLLPILEELCQWSGNYYKEQSDVVMPHCLNCEYYRRWKKE